MARISVSGGYWTRDCRPDTRIRRCPACKSESCHGGMYLVKLRGYGLGRKVENKGGMGRKARARPHINGRAVDIGRPKKYANPKLRKYG